MKPAEQIEHKGTILSIESGVVRLSIVVMEACGACASRKVCSMGSAEKREVVVYTDNAENYSVGETVNVVARQSAGVLAVVLCYVVPLVVLVGALVVAVSLGADEGIAALISLTVTALYFAVLSLFKGRLSKKVTFTINKI